MAYSVDIIRVGLKFSKIWPTSFTRKSDQNSTIFDPKSDPNIFWHSRALWDLCLDEYLVHFLNTSKTQHKVKLINRNNTSWYKLNLEVKFLKSHFAKVKNCTGCVVKIGLVHKYLSFSAFWGQNLTSIGYFGPKSQILWPWSDWSHYLQWTYKLTLGHSQNS